jgi:hypothetical protein
MKRIVKTIRWSLPLLFLAFVCTEGEPTEQAAAGIMYDCVRLEVKDGP